ncbi:hypothetical protein KUTeg_023947 [Tegillarca granosa]|uniref:BTB domain-containing protein n=1 Tax=Tegillarca granosa TaxID=220873 RepID=A0ABQ9E141_TEGGR|nr:hypothetical protein KUTeg_023947 [Tegillarca granosa]
MSSLREASHSFEDEPSVLLFKDREGLTVDLSYVASVPDLCDVKFLVGPDRLPVYGVRAVLSTRSRIFYHHIMARQIEMKLEEKRKNTKILKVFKKMCKVLRVKIPDNINKDGIPKITILVDSFDVRVFERLIRYVHCGIVSVDTETAVGLMNAANKFEFPELKRACWDFVLDCVGPETLPIIMATASYYSHFKETGRLLENVRTPYLFLGLGLNPSK